MERTVPFYDFALVCNTSDGTRPMVVFLVSENSTRLEIDFLLLCAEGKILGSRLLEPATNCSPVRLVFILKEALSGCSSRLRFILSPTDRVTNVITLSTICYLM